MYGGIGCYNCGSECKLGYFGEQCEYCQTGFYVGNDQNNGKVDPVTGEGPLCKGN